MKTNDISPAQKNLLAFIKENTPDTIYTSIKNTVCENMVNGANDPSHDGSAGVSCAALNDWFFLLELMDHLRKIELEDKN